MSTIIIPEFSLPSEIFIRPEVVQSVSDIIARFGKRTVILCTSEDMHLFSDIAQDINSSLNMKEIGCMIYDNLPKYPNTEDIDEAANFIKKANCSTVIGLGGVESINAAKAVSILINNYIFCDDIFKGEALPNAPLDLITIPCLPLFGFEIAPLFYIQDVKKEQKKVFFDKRLYPKATIIDPNILRILPSVHIAKMGIASLAISLESVISRASNDIINTFAFKSIDIIFRNLAHACKGTSNAEPLSFISLASLMSGIAFSSAYSSSAMAIALPLTLEADIDIAEAISVLLPYIMEYNLTASAGKYVQIAKVMGEDVRNITVIEAAVKAVEAIRRLSAEVDIPQKLSTFNINKQAFKKVAKTAMGYSFLGNMPKAIDTGEIEAILIAATNE